MAAAESVAANALALESRMKKIPLNMAPKKALVQIATGIDRLDPVLSGIREGAGLGTEGVQSRLKIMQSKAISEMQRRGMRVNQSDIRTAVDNSFKAEISDALRAEWWGFKPVRNIATSNPRQTVREQAAATNVDVLAAADFAITQARKEVEQGIANYEALKAAFAVPFLPGKYIAEAHAKAGALIKKYAPMIQFAAMAAKTKAAAEKVLPFKLPWQNR
jgi:hypothetical protein